MSFVTGYFSCVISDLRRRSASNVISHFSDKIRKLITFRFRSHKDVGVELHGQTSYFLLSPFPSSSQTQAYNSVQSPSNIYDDHKFILAISNCNSKRTLIKLSRTPLRYSDILLEYNSFLSANK